MTCTECFITPNLIAWREVKEIEALRLDCIVCKGKCTTQTQDSFSLHFWDGVKSGFPVCCILFFCNVWIPLRESKRMFSYGEHRDYSTGVGYVQCPECILENLK